ncbi:hypothetical protein MVEN_00113100 [Mycena venus]|uniref:Uncharacterized protein n=1 Tax=Mycena venus TaxID=2733690 RepID=A0A8H6Z7W3_9AGAR|nr:hypothetical protein MVEN_00113100 [Mycena venus]
MRQACTVLSQCHRYWQQAPSSRMFQTIFTPGGLEIPERINTFRAHGRFLALHCLLMRHGPLPISIWLLLCLIEGREALLIPQNVLLHMHPGAYDILAPWYDFHEDTPVPPAMEATHPLWLFIFKHMPQIQPSVISNSRTRAEHEGWLISTFATVLLGHSMPWALPEYLGLQDGFNMTVGAIRLAESIKAFRASPFLVTIYDRCVHNINEVFDHLHFNLTTRASNLTTPYYAKLFKIRLHHYLCGVGHPPELRSRLIALGISEEIDVTANDPLLRANLVLVCGTDSDLRPTQDDWAVTVHIRLLSCLLLIHLDQFKIHGRDTRESQISRPLGFQRGENLGTGQWTHLDLSRACVSAHHPDSAPRERRFYPGAPDPDPRKLQSSRPAAESNMPNGSIVPSEDRTQLTRALYPVGVQTLEGRRLVAASVMSYRQLLRTTPLFPGSRPTTGSWDGCYAVSVRIKTASTLGHLTTPSRFTMTI